MKTKFLASLFVLSLLAIAGCETAPTSRPTIQPFDPAAFVPYRQPGTGKISGQAFLKTRGGDIKLGAGNKVTLSPATAFNKEVRMMRDQGIEPSNYTDAEIAQFKDTIRNTIADAQGNFEFSGLPAGEYLLEVVIRWEVPGQYGLDTTGGIVHKNVTIKDGESVKVMLTE
jgi:hypothetical protein